MMRWLSIQKDKASNSTGLRRADVCRSLGAALCLFYWHNLMSIDATHNDRWDLSFAAVRERITHNGGSIAAATFKGTFNGQVEQRFGLVEIVAGKPVIEPR